MNNVMLDLETLGLDSDAVIVSIGAVEFDPVVGLGQEFYQVVKADKQASKWGRTVSTSTLEWWLQQSAEARKVLHDPSGVYLDTALSNFTRWLRGRNMNIWGYGAHFDNVVLESAYKAAAIPVPWGYTNNRCHRTLKALNLPGDVLVFEGTEHNALDDAKHQARQACIWLRTLNRLTTISKAGFA